MKITISIDGRMVSVEVSAEVAECLDAGRRKSENLSHERRRYWDKREFDEYIVAVEGRLPPTAPARRNWSASGKPGMKSWRCWPCVPTPSGSGSCSMRCMISAM